MAKESSVSSRRAKLQVRSAGGMMSARERKELAALAKMPDSVIDTSDIPEVTNWSKAQVGRFYHPTKQPVTAVNKVLREHIGRQAADNSRPRQKRNRGKAE
jgi:hypothetical protein